MKLAFGVPPRIKTAIADARYVHRYNYSTQHQGWILITGAQLVGETSIWSFRLVEPIYGMPVGEVMTTNLDLWADRFANRPFDVESPVEEQRDWFYRLCGPYRSASRMEEMYSMYVDYMQHSSSYASLRAAGIVVETDRMPAHDLSWLKVQDIPMPEITAGPGHALEEFQSQSRLLRSKVPAILQFYPDFSLSKS